MTVNKKIIDKFQNISEMVNNTPMIEIYFKYKGRERKIYAKAEYYNYTGSIKDRIAYYILKHSYLDGILKEGDLISEATSGNTGISFAALGTYLGNPVTIFMPDWMSKERVNLMESFGAKIKTVSENEGGFKGCISLSDKLGMKKNTFLPHQFSNSLNIDAHCNTTGKEIISQINKLGKKPDGIVAGIGTGGTLMGIKTAVQKIYPDCKAFPVEPLNSPTLSTDGKTYNPHKIAGIGDEFVPDIVNLNELDNIISVDDDDAINMSRKLAMSLGLGVGISSGANFLGAVKAQDLLKNDEAVIITVFADDNKKYLSTDLMKEQKIKPEHIGQNIELIGLKAIK